MNDEEPMNHPPAWALDAVAAGDAPSSAEPHLAACEACKRYVEALRDEAEAFRSTAKPRAFAQQVQARATGRRPAGRGVQGLTPLLHACVRSRRWLAVPALAAAVAFVVWPSRAPVTDATGTPSGEHFKGSMTLTVVRERAGEQDRLTGPFEVEPGDRIRLEVAVDHERPVAAGVLSADGSWAPLLSAVPLGTGTHYSELAARFDDAPTDAVVIVGSPPDVDRARATRNFTDVIAWRVTSAPKR